MVGEFKNDPANIHVDFGAPEIQIGAEVNNTVGPHCGGRTCDHCNMVPGKHYRLVG